MGDYSCSECTSGFDYALRSSEKLNYVAGDKLDLTE